MCAYMCVLCVCACVYKIESKTESERERDSRRGKTRPVASFISREVAWVKKLYGCARMGKITSLGLKNFWMEGER